MLNIAADSMSLSGPHNRFRKALWLAAAALGLFVLTLAAGNFFLPRERAVSLRMLGHDFLAFYTAACFVHEGRPAQMYDLDAVRRFQRQTAAAADLEMGDGFGPFWNPPFYALALAPLGKLPYRQALYVWWAASLAALALATVFLCRMFPPGAGWRTWGLVPLLLALSLPAQQAFTHGQNTFFSLLILSAAVALWRSAVAGRLRTPRSRAAAVAAGMVAALLAYKPQVGAVVCIVMIICLGWRALAGMVIVGAGLLAATELAAPGLIGVWLARMPDNLAAMQEQRAYYWERHVTLKAFWRLLIQGHAAGADLPLVRTPWGLCTLGFASALFATAVRVVRQQRAVWPALAAGGRAPPRRAQGAHDRLISAAVVCGPLLAPFYFDYDLLLTAVAAVLFAAEHTCPAAAPQPPAARQRLLASTWVVFYAWQLAGPGLVARLGMNITTLLLGALAAMHIGAAGRPFGPAFVTETKNEIELLAMDRRGAADRGPGGAVLP